MISTAIGTACGLGIFFLGMICANMLTGKSSREQHSLDLTEKSVEALIRRNELTENTNELLERIERAIKEG